jgi:hypothetical protein
MWGLRSPVPVVLSSKTARRGGLERGVSTRAVPSNRRLLSTAYAECVCEGGVNRQDSGVEVVHATHQILVSFVPDLTHATVAISVKFDGNAALSRFHEVVSQLVDALALVDMLAFA